MKIIFTHPLYLWFLVILPILILAHLFVLKGRKSMALKFSNFEALEKVTKKSFITHHRGIITARSLILVLSRTLTYSFFILAISGIMLEYKGNVSGFDFVLAIDSSSSMLANDFSPNRLEAAKEAALMFADSVSQADIGVVSFAGEVSTDLRPEKNSIQVKSSIKGIKLSGTGGTNIGDALITSANLFEGESPRRIILLTDGQSNTGTEPSDSLVYLKSKNITVYTIGVATMEGGQVSEGLFTSKLDETTLKQIAEDTNGKYYRASDKESLNKIFEEIASSTVNTTAFDLSWIFLMIGFVILAVGWFLASTKFRVLP